MTFMLRKLLPGQHANADSKRERERFELARGTVSSIITPRRVLHELLKRALGEAYRLRVIEFGHDIGRSMQVLRLNLHTGYYSS